MHWFIGNACSKEQFDCVRKPPPHCLLLFFEDVPFHLDFASGYLLISWGLTSSFELDWWASKVASFLSQSFEVIKYYLDWLPPDTANIHAWLILDTTATTGGGVLFSGRFFAQRANLRTFLCTFAGLKNAAVSQNWQISGMYSRFRNVRQYVVERELFK